MKVIVKKLGVNVDKALFSKQLDSGEIVELQLGPNAFVRLMQGREGRTIEVRSYDGSLEVVPLVSNNIVLRIKKP